jgi:xanthine dehydrogenase molybdenum-binding subunit
MSIGQSVKRVDALDKVTGRAKYTDDLADKGALVAKILHATIAHGQVKSMDVSAAQAIPGVVKVVTCFDVPPYKFPTAGHPWSTDPGHQDVADRLLLTKHIRFYGDDIAAVVAEDEVAAQQALRAIKVEYEAFPFVLDAQEAMKPEAPQLHEEYPGNILNHTSIRLGNYAEAIKEPGLIKVEGWYDTPTVQHCHIENHIAYAYQEGKRITVVASTQIPHIVRRIVGQALGIPWGDVRIIKPYIGGGFGNKQDALYEPLCAYLSTVVGGRLVKLDVSREETFVCNRVRHAIRTHIISWVRPDGSFAARKIECFSDQGAYASHGHGVVAKGMGAFPQLYPCPNVEGDAYSVFTNKPAAGAMRGYGIPQAMFAGECHMEDVARALGVDSIQFRKDHRMPVGYVDGFSKNENYADSLGQCMEKGMEYLDYERKRKEYANQTGPVRRGVGMALFWYNTAVWPISLESSSCRMVLNQDGSIQLQLGETEIGQGADTAFAQMAADTVGIPVDMVHTVSTQDTDLTPFGTGAYASRQTYVGGFAIKQTGLLLKERILLYAKELTRQDVNNLDIQEGYIVRTTDGRKLMRLGELATEALYSLTHSQHMTAESTYQIKNNAYSFGCSFAEVEVDIPLCKVKLIDMVNVHDCGRLINPALAEAQVHGGMSMAIGYGLSEQLLFDPKTGKPLNNNLLDYKLSTTMDHPDLAARFVENYEPTSPFGTKALGEPPACSGAPAIRNAILNATGVAIDRAPITPHVLFAKFKEAGLL